MFLCVVDSVFGAVILETSKVIGLLFIETFELNVVDWVLVRNSCVCTLVFVAAYTKPK